MCRFARRLLPSARYAPGRDRPPRQFDRRGDRRPSGPWEREPPSPSPMRDLKQGWRGDALYGYNPVLAALTAQRRTIHRLYIRDSGGEEPKKSAALTARLVQLAEAQGVPVEGIGKHELNLLTDNKAHQGYVLECSPLDFEQLDDLGPGSDVPGTRPPVWLALDEVTDVQNLGAALRTAFFLGIAGVLTCARNSAPLSPAVSKASAGAVEHMAVHSCRAMQRTLQQAADAGWHVLGAAAEAGSQPCTQVTVDRPTVLVMGSEGSGLRTLVRRACTQLVRVDGLTDDARLRGVDSLNVSVAAGILLHQLLNASRPRQ